MRKILITIGCYLILSAFSLTAAEALDTECQKSMPQSAFNSYLGKIELAYNGVSSIRAEFIQSRKLLAINQQLIDRGTVAFKKPGMMDWQFQGQKQKRFVSDGEIFQFYEPDLNQVTVFDFEDGFSSRVPLSFLLGVGKLREEFNVKSICRSSDGLVVVLDSKQADEDLQSFTLVVSDKTFLPIGARIVDAGGNETTLELNKVNTADSIAAEHFAFRPPLGTDIISYQKEKSSTIPFKLKEEELISPKVN